MAVLDAIATAYLDRERKRLGLPSREELAMKRAAEERAAAAAASQLETGALGREKMRAEIAALPAEQELNRRATEALITQREREPRPLAPRSPHYVTDAEGNVRAIDPETFEVRELGPIGQPQRDPMSAGYAIGPTVTMSDPQGNPIIVDKRTGKPVGAPAPTAEMRNTEYQSGAVEPAFELVKQSLEGFKQAAAGGLPGAPSAMIPGTDAYYAMNRFRDQAKALLGAIVARQAGEGSRLSDEDRVAYSQAASLVNGALLLPGGPEEAEKRIDQAQKLIADVMARRKMVGAGQGIPAGAQPPATPTRPAGVPPEAQWDPVTRRWRL